jgi:hypothetical protein
MSTPAAGPRARFHAYLRRLHAKGRSNMYGAVPYLMRAFGLARDDAFRIVCEWIDARDSETASPPVQTERPRQRTPRPRLTTRKRRGTTS